MSRETLSSSSSRWCPTPEQLMILEEFYRAGIRTPSATQVEQITCYLSYHGKIEGKNVFYWFQNHKARERQKKLRKLTFSKHHCQPTRVSTSCQLLHGRRSSSAAVASFGIHQAPLCTCTSSSSSSSVAAYLNQQEAAKDHQVQKRTMSRRRNYCDHEPRSSASNLREYDQSWRAEVTLPLRTLQLFPVPAVDLGQEANPPT